MKKFQQQANKLINYCQKADNISLLTHVNPDGDAIGSSLGLYGFLKNTGKKVNLIVPNVFPDFLKWMKGAEESIVYTEDEEKANEIIKQSDLIICLDLNELSRIDKIQEVFNHSKAIKVLIDHHPKRDAFADFAIVETKVSSAAELVFHLIDSSGNTKKIDKDIAECIFAGIMTDTGNFSHGYISTETYKTLGVLSEIGIDKDKIFDKVYNNFSIERMKLLGYCLNEKMVVLPELKAAYISITDDELKKYKYIPGDTEGFVNIPFSIKGIEVTALFIEKETSTKVSLRSKGDIPINQMAKECFNGGGHKNAAGGESERNIEDTISAFIKQLPKYG